MIEKKCIFQASVYKKIKNSTNYYKSKSKDSLIAIFYKNYPREQFLKIDLWNAQVQQKICKK